MPPLFAVSPTADAAHQFILFGWLHLSILFLTIAIPVVMGITTRRPEGLRLGRVFALTLASVLLANYGMLISWAVHVGRITRWPEALPMHLCDWAAIATIIALVWRRQLVYELAYFWGLSGTFQAVVTPDLPENFPSPLFIDFFILHCGIIVGVLFMTWGFRQRPHPGAIFRAWLWSQVYLVCAGLVDWTFQVNFGYLAAKPAHPSLLDFFGPWPWYILTLEVIGLVFYGFFYLPFWVAHRRRKLRQVN